MSTTTIHTARKTRHCGSYQNSDEHTIDAGSLYLRHVGFPGDEGCEEITQPQRLEECATCADRGGDWLRFYYGVPAAIGGRITSDHDGRTGIIASFVGGCLNVVFDGERFTTPVHPTDVTYREAINA